MARLARPLMRNGGAVITVSFYGASKVVRHYNLMGPVKAALEASVRAAAVDLSPLNIRVFTLSAGAVATRAASGIDRFDELLDTAREQTPNHHPVSIGQIGDVAANFGERRRSAVDGVRGSRRPWVPRRQLTAPPQTFSPRTSLA